ncbi:MAG: response regulator [Planctomycetes bacterium]|nr:response regulator [Planctomycetota bacterium]
MSSTSSGEAGGRAGTRSRRLTLVSKTSLAVAGLGILIVAGMGTAAYLGERAGLVELVYQENVLLADALARTLEARAGTFTSVDDFVDRFQRESNGLYVGEEGYLCILDAEGRVLLHSRRPDLRGVSVGDRAVIGAEGDRRSLLEVLGAGAPFAGRYFTLAGKEELLSLAPIEPLHVFVTVHQPYEIVTRRLDAARRRTLLAGLLVLLIAPFLGVLLLQRIVGPYYRELELARETEYRERLAASEARYRELFGANTDATFVVEAATHVILEANHAAAKLTGVSAEELCRLRVEQLFPEAERPTFANVLVEVASGHECQDREGFHVQGPAGARPVAVNVKQLRQLGRPVYLTLLRETSERERHRQQRIQREKLAALGTLISGVAHELNNPLGSILGLSELLGRDAKEPKTQEDLRILIAEARRCRTLVQDLLAVVRRESTPKEALDLPGLLEDALASLSPPLATLGIEVVREMDTGLPRVLGHRGQLHRAFLNLLANARDAVLDRGGPKRIVTRMRAEPGDGRLVRIEIEDSGTGIPPENLTRIFDPFFTTKPIGQGTGLGLALVAGVVRDHGGSVTTANAPGGGAIFRIELPHLDESPGAAAAEAALSALTPTSTDASVLVVEDEPGMAYMIRRTLTEVGYQVECLHEPAAALDLVSRRPFDLILSDVRLPGSSGWRLYQSVCARDAAYADRFLFVTGDVLGDLSGPIEKAKRPILRKPFTVKELVDTVKGTLAHVGSRKTAKA